MGMNEAAGLGEFRVMRTTTRLTRKKTSTTKKEEENHVRPKREEYKTVPFQRTELSGPWGSPSRREK